MPISKEFGCGVGDVSLYYTIDYCGTGLFIPITSRIIKKNLKLSIIISLACIVVANLGYSISHSVYMFYLFASISGFGRSILGGGLIQMLINSWFEKKSGTALGIVLAVSALTGVIMNPIVASNISKFGWRTSYRISLIIILIFFVPALILLRISPESMGMLPYGYEVKEGEEENLVIEHKGIMLAEAKKTRYYFYIITVGIFVSCIFGMTNHMATYAVSLGYTPAMGAYLTSACLIGSTVGKLTIGMIYDRYGAKVKLRLVMSLVLVGAAIVYFGEGSIVTLVIGALIFGYGACTGASMPGALINNVFGPRDFGSILASVTMVNSVISSFNGTFYGKLYDATGSYHVPLLCCVCFAIIALTLGTISLNNGYKYKTK